LHFAINTTTYLRNGMTQLIVITDHKLQSQVPDWTTSLHSLSWPWQGCSPRGVCLGSRRPRGSFFSWLGLASASHSLASVSTLLPRPWLCLMVSASVLAWSGR